MTTLMKRNIKEQIPKNEEKGQIVDRSEGKSGVCTPRAAEASSRESEREPEDNADLHLLRFGGSATGGSAPPMETNTSARTTQGERRKRNTKRGLRSKGAKERRNIGSNPRISILRILILLLLAFRSYIGF